MIFILESSEEFNYLPKLVLTVTRTISVEGTSSIFGKSSATQFPIPTEPGRALTSIRQTTPTTRNKNRGLI